MIKIPVILILAFLILGGCYTMLRHPEIEAYYDDKDSQQSFVEEFDVVVDEDCISCHNGFQVSKYFAPLSPAHHSSWSQTPWWFDDNYKAIFGSSATEESEEYESSQSAPNNKTPAKLPPAYIRSPQTTDDPVSTRVSKTTDPDSTQDSSRRDESGRKTSDSSRRKFRKRN